MAKRKVNKSQAVRDMLAKGTGSPKEIAATLNKKGVKVSAAYVSNIKTQMAKKNGEAPRRGRRPKGARVNRVAATTSSNAMMQAIDLVLGAGPKEAHKLVDMASDMISKVARRV